MESNKDLIGHFIKMRREAVGLKQWQLANLVGITRKSMNEIERGKRQPRPVHKEAIAKALNCTVNDLHIDPNGSTAKSEYEIDQIIEKATVKAINESISRISHSEQLSEQERELLRLFKDLSGRNRRLVVGFIGRIRDGKESLNHAVSNLGRRRRTASR